MTHQTGIKVKLSGTDGNAFSVLGKVKAAMKKGGIDDLIIREFIGEATSGDYNHLLGVCCDYCEIR